LGKKVYEEADWSGGMKSGDAGTEHSVETCYVLLQMEGNGGGADQLKVLQPG